MNVALRTKLLIGAAAAIGVYVLFAPGETDTVVPVKAQARRGEAAAARATANAARPSHSGAFAQLAHRVADSAAADALFGTHSWYQPPPPPAPLPKVEAAPAPPPVPQAPPLPFTFMGSYAPNGGAAVFFLTQGDRVYDVHVGDTLENIYKVAAFSNNQLVLTYMPLNIQQSLPAGSGP
jgi:hypothetical protein